MATVEKLITPDIQKPARYLGNEKGAIHKPWEQATVRWVLTYPEVYELGASNLGHIILYNILNTQPHQLCDRAYLPGPDLAEKLRELEIPLFALESQKSLLEFDILGFNLSYELGGTNILEMLDLAQIPLTWKERENGNYPLIFAGGQTATSNPEPFADFFDFMALGDGEELLPEIGLIVEEGKKAGLSKNELLLDLAQIPGVYVPKFYDMTEEGAVLPNRDDVPARILRRVAPPMPSYGIGLVPYVETIHDRLVVEIRRGCTRGCRFCQPGMLTRPARDVEPEKIIEAIEKGIRETGYNEFSLLSLSCSDYLALPSVGLEIKNRLKNENIANIIGGMRPSSLTFAPEAGTQRMRDVINKGLTNEELLRGVKTAVEQGWDKIKLYFMIGLPGETDTDVLGIAETVQWLRRECWQKGRKPLSFTLTISNFTPKPHTPFQWHSVSTSEFLRKQNLLKDAFRQIKGVKANYTDIRVSAMEDFVGRGDRRLSSVIRRAWELGAGMDAWWENANKAYQAWETAISEAGLSWKYRQVEKGEWNVFEEGEGQISQENLYDAPLPWDHINTGIDKQWLKDDLQRALEAATVPDCAFEGCSHCGVCGLDFGHNIVVPPPPIPEFQGQFQPPTNRVQRFRVIFGKQGKMALISHLDLQRLFDRSMRRSALPISFTGGFHPSPRISIANALTLGYTSSGEIVDFELYDWVNLEEFTEKLQAQLPDELPIYHVEEVDIKSLSATRLLEKAEYLITLGAFDCIGFEQWLDWIEILLKTPEILWEKTTKSGKKQTVNLCDRLFDISLESRPQKDTAILKVVGSCRNDGSLLHPQQVLYLFEKVSNMDFCLLQVHRQKLILNSV